MSRRRNNPTNLTSRGRSSGDEPEDPTAPRPSTITLAGGTTSKAAVSGNVEIAPDQVKAQPVPPLAPGKPSVAGRSYWENIFRAGGHGIDQFLKSQVVSPHQPSLFDSFDDRHQGEIKIYAARHQQNPVELVNRRGAGINLPDNYKRLLFVLWLIAHEQSENTTDPKRSDFYAGKGLVPLSVDGATLHGTLILPTPFEAAKLYTGKSKPSGRDMEQVEGWLYDLADNPDLKCAVHWTHIEQLPNGETDEVTIRRFASLVDIGDETRKRRNAKGEVISVKEKMQIVLHPVLTDQISTKWVGFPTDFLARVRASVKGKRMHQGTLDFIIYLVRALSGKPKDWKTEMSEAKLFQMIAPQYVKSGRKKLRESLRDQAFASAEAVGILSSWEIAQGADGKAKYIWEVNPRWCEKPLKP